MKHFISIIIQFVVIGFLLVILSKIIFIPMHETRWTLDWQKVPENIRENNDYIRCMTVADNGDLWAGSNNGVIHVNGKHMEIYASSILRHIRDIEVAPNGDVWVLTERNDVLRFNGYTWQQIPSERIADITIDLDGIVWAATYEYIAKFENDEWVPYIFKLVEAEHGSGICAVDAAQDGSLWAANCAREMTLYKIVGSKVTHTDPINVYGSTQKIRTNNVNQTWIYSMGYKSSTSAFGYYENDNGYTDLEKYVGHDFAITENNITWIASYKGLCRFNGLFCQYYLPEEIVSTVAYSPDGSVWLGLENQIVKLSR